MPTAAKLLGLILAGGLARRMGGGDKPLRTIGGVPILARVIACLAPQCAALVLNANGDPARFAAFGLPVIADEVPGFAGPLAGLLAGLDHAAARGFDAVVSAPGDCPFLPADLVERFDAAGSSVACAASGGRVHHVIGLWPVALRDDLRHALVVDGERAVGRFAARHAPTIVEWPAAPIDPFFNANTPDDLAQAERLAGSWSATR